MDLPRNDDGTFVKFAFPGGYPVFYLDKQGDVYCSDCANRETDQSQEIVTADINYENDALYCDDCETQIDCAY